MNMSRKPRPAVAADPWVTVKHAARVLEIAPQTVYARANAGLLVTQLVAGRTFVDRASMLALKREQDAARKRVA